MNERIKQLLGQAYDEAVPETWTTLSSLQQGRIYEKFARLIVKECVTLARSKSDFIIEQALLYGDRDEEVSARATAWQFTVLEQEVKRHFGVEE